MSPPSFLQQHLCGINLPWDGDKVVLSHLELIANECPFRHSSQDDNIQEKQTQIFTGSGQNVHLMNLEHCFHCRAFLFHLLSSVFQ